jgi:hypothetical protein
MGRDGAVLDLIWANREWNYFCKWGWTEKSLICPSGHQPLAGMTEAICKTSWFETRGVAALLTMRADVFLLRENGTLMKLVLPIC